MKAKEILDRSNAVITNTKATAKATNDRVKFNRKKMQENADKLASLVS